MKRLLIKLKMCWLNFNLDCSFYLKNEGHIDPKDYQQILQDWRIKILKLKADL